MACCGIPSSSAYEMTSERERYTAKTIEGTTSDYATLTPPNLWRKVGSPLAVEPIGDRRTPLSPTFLTISPARGNLIRNRTAPDCPARLDDRYFPHEPRDFQPLLLQW